MSAHTLAFPLQTPPKPAQSSAKPRTLNARQEEFRQAYVQLGNGTKAAFRAGYSPHAARQQAARLLTNANILHRIAEVRRDLGLRNKIDRETVMAKLETAYRGAIVSCRYLTAVRAAEAQARLAGLFPETAAAGAQRPGANGENREPNGGKRETSAPEAELVPGHDPR